MTPINYHTTAVRFISMRGYVYEVAVESVWQHIREYEAQRHTDPHELDQRMIKLRTDPEYWVNWIGNIWEWRHVHEFGTLLRKEPRDSLYDRDPIDCMICLDSEQPRTFILGNALRGCFEGEFSSMDEAWAVLSARFLLSYPSVKGRTVSMWVQEMNHYGMHGKHLCKEGVTFLGTVSDSAINLCRQSAHQG